MPTPKKNENATPKTPVVGTKVIETTVLDMPKGQMSHKQAKRLHFHAKKLGIEFIELEAMPIDKAHSEAQVKTWKDNGWEPKGDGKVDLSHWFALGRELLEAGFTKSDLDVAFRKQRAGTLAKVLPGELLGSVKTEAEVSKSSWRSVPTTPTAPSAPVQMVQAPAAPVKASDNKAKLQRLMAIGFSLDEALAAIEGQ